jgi:hypothetical protein
VRRRAVTIAFGALIAVNVAVESSATCTGAPAVAASPSVAMQPGARPAAAPERPSTPE